jgi:uncharacterized protein (TIGR03492 family)
LTKATQKIQKIKAGRFKRKMSPMLNTDVLIVSGGNAEDLIGATLARQLVTAGITVGALPLVGPGKRYQGVADIYGPAIQMPSEGFLFNSFSNLVADLRAGFATQTFKQLIAAQAARKKVSVVAVVGDAFSLVMGCVAAGWGRHPLFHLQPQVSQYYWGGRTTLERLRQINQFGAEDYIFYERWMHRFVQAVYVRDKLSEQRAHQLGMHKASFVGGMAMDTLGPPERDLSSLRDGRPVLVLLPGSRGDVSFSLPLMLEAAKLLPELQAWVAWAGDFSEIKAAGWELRSLDQDTLTARQGQHTVWLFRKAFSAILHSSSVAIGTAGTANEQAAGMSIPVVAFPTLGPQYISSNAQRQARLLGRALVLVDAEVAAITSAVRARLQEGPLRQEAIQDGLERNGPRGALATIATHIHQALG